MKVSFILSVMLVRCEPMWLGGSVPRTICGIFRFLKEVVAKDSTRLSQDKT